MDQLDNDGQVNMARTDRASRTTGQKRKRGTEPFPATTTGIRYIALDGWIECACLLANAFFNRVKVRIYQLHSVL
jgi:hypothetical protein